MPPVSRRLRRLSPAFLLFAVSCSRTELPRPETAQAEPITETASLAIFEKRILPIFQSPKPSSCAECHLSGVDLKEYIRPTQQETFASLLAADLIDAENPDDSKILRFISRRPEQPNLVTEKVRQQEYEAFRTWIRAAVADPKLLAAKDKSESVGPELPIEVVRHARKDRVLASFIENVWTEVGRCAACHSPDRNQKQVNEHGEQVSWIKLRDPAGSSDRSVFGPKNLWQHSLTLTAPRGSKWAEEIGSERLPPGRYLVKLYVDQTGKLQDDFTAKLGQEDFVGQVEIESQWPAGYGRMTVVEFPAK